MESKKESCKGERNERNKKKREIRKEIGNKRRGVGEMKGTRKEVWN